jgi:hypothetical protein
MGCIRKENKKKKKTEVDDRTVYMKKRVSAKRKEKISWRVRPGGGRNKAG